MKSFLLSCINRLPLYSIFTKCNVFSSCQSIANFYTQFSRYLKNTRLISYLYYFFLTHIFMPTCNFSCDRVLVEIVATSIFQHSFSHFNAGETHSLHVFLYKQRKNVTLSNNAALTESTYSYITSIMMVFSDVSLLQKYI